MRLQNRRLSFRAVAATTLAAGALGTALAAGGHVAVAGIVETSCAYVASGPPGVRGNYLQIQQQGGSRALTINRARRTIVVSDPSQVECAGPAPTVDNIDRIFLLSDSRRFLRLDLRTGALGPGASETGRGAEIEIFLRVSGAAGPQGVQLTVLAGKAPNTVTFGRAAGSEQFNLNARRERLDDTDVYIESIDYARSSFHTGLAGGDNTIDGRGPGRLRPSGLSATFHMSGGANRIFGPLGPSHLHTGRGADLLIGGPEGDFVASGPAPDRLDGGSGGDYMAPGIGRDRVEGGPGDDTISTNDTDPDTIDCGPGNDTARAGEEDILRDCETVTRI